MSNSRRRARQLVVDELVAERLILNETNVVTAVLVGSGEVIDANGEPDAIILDAAQVVRLDGSSAGKLRIKISGAYDFEALANIFRAISGSVIETNTINETTAASGVTIDSLLVKDGGLVAAGILDANGLEIILDADADTSITADTDDTIDIRINGADDFQLTANTLTALSGSVIKTNTIDETTGASGVTIDGALIKDGRTDAGNVVQELTASGAITINSGQVHLNHATVAVAATLDAPVAGDRLFIVDTSATGTAAHTVTLPAGVTFDGTNNTATLNLLGEALHMIAISATRWLIVNNIGSVGLSTV